MTRIELNPDEDAQLRAKMLCCDDISLVVVSKDEAKCEACGASWGILTLPPEKKEPPERAGGVE